MKGSSGDTRQMEDIVNVCVCVCVGEYVFLFFLHRFRK